MIKARTTEVRLKGVDGFESITVTASPAAEVSFAYYEEEDDYMEKAEWLALSESVLAKAWNNPKDAEYDEL
ncbi:MAG: hypothetical protein WD379_09645 [Dehalococcoidia bacterium]